ncbi:MAG: Pyrrolysyl-tRNA-synthetase PylS [Candidatus Methanohalarchaeum thermophilum]|uniref:Pyrrolysyl-tRNA-synthetase PylS n=1 Tax=Methanohalarchaeum thermophilum TaxID=1903181 RepID=A0A1Q6DXK2_METT1|nr:MAG: Pyrrolysyl-tRNA-synthetase PylS [Candidatus Methanohalarchaeum thermophilum]
MEFTETQKQRLRELGYKGEFPELDTKEEVNEAYSQLEKKLRKKHRKKLNDLFESKKPTWKNTVENIRQNLQDLGFIEVQTPLIISKNLLKKMKIDQKSDLMNQVYRINDNKVLRPMLAQNLYKELENFSKLSNRDTIQLFEIGTCFRKEKGGKDHLNEFKMLNAVELGNFKDKEKRLKEVISTLFKDFDEYVLEKEKSTVYGETYDVLVNGTELASCAIGPHQLDEKWDINRPWIGIGIGIERFTRELNNSDSTVKAYGRSFVYQDGIRLDIK